MQLTCHSCIEGRLELQSTSMAKEFSLFLPLSLPSSVHWPRPYRGWIRNEMQPIWHRNGQLRENGQNFVAREGSTIILKNVYNVYIFLELVAGVFTTIIPPPSSLSRQLQHSSWCNWKLRGLVCATNFGEQSSWFYHGGFMPNDGRLPSCNYKLHTHTHTESVCVLFRLFYFLSFFTISCRV